MTPSFRPRTIQVRANTLTGTATLPQGGCSVERVGRREGAHSLNLLVQDIWNQVLDGFSRRHGDALRDLWLKHTRPMSFSKGLFVLGVPNLFIREWLERKYLGDLETLFTEVTGSPVKVMIRIDGYLYRLMRRVRPAAKVREDETGAGGGREGGSAATIARGTYVVRPENRFVYSLFERLLRDPTGAFNPLYFYGPEGVGKTHLLERFFRRAMDGGRYTSCYKVGAVAFAREFGRAARVGDRVRFRGAILRCHLFALEDVQELEGKLRVQQEFLSILKYLVERNRQVVITGARHPREIRLFEGALASFLLSGMVVSIQGYGFNSMVEILSRRCMETGVDVPPTLVETIARGGRGSVGPLLRLLEEVTARAEKEGVTPTPAFLRRHFPSYASIGAGEDSVDRIIELVSRRMGVDRGLVASNSKRRGAVTARHLVIYLATRHLNTPSRRICRWLGNISPSIVPYARRKIDARRSQDPAFNRLVLELQTEVEGGQKFLF